MNFSGSTRPPYVGEYYAREDNKVQQKLEDERAQQKKETYKLHLQIRRDQIKGIQLGDTPY